MFTAGNSSRLLTFYGLFRMLDNPVASLCLAEKFSSKNDILRANVELILFYTLHILASSDGEEEFLCRRIEKSPACTISSDIIFEI